MENSYIHLKTNHILSLKDKGLNDEQILRVDNTIDMWMFGHDVESKGMHSSFKLLPKSSSFRLNNDAVDVFVEDYSPFKTYRVKRLRKITVTQVKKLDMDMKEILSIGYSLSERGGETDVVKNSYTFSFFRFRDGLEINISNKHLVKIAKYSTKLNSK